MHILRVEHPVADFGTWKRSFDSDPAHREASGVGRYRILRAVDDPAFVTVDLEFDTLTAAEAFLVTLQKVWGRVTGTLIDAPRGRLLEAVEVKEY
jgi:hypothetical protein